MGSSLSLQLIDAGIISADDAEQIGSLGLSEPEHRIGVLVANGIREDALAGFFVDRGFGPLIDDTALADPQRRAVRAIPRRLADRLTALPLEVTEQGVIVAMADPTDTEAILELQRTMGERVVPTVALYSSMRAAIANAYRPSSAPPPPNRSHNAESFPKTTRPPFQSVLPLVRQKSDASKRPMVPNGKGSFSSPPRTATSDVWDAAFEAAQQKVEPSRSRPPPPTALEIAPQLASLEQCVSRDEVIDRACAIGAGDHAGALFLAVRQGVFRGHTGTGSGVSKDAVANLIIPNASASVLTKVYNEGSAYHGGWGSNAADQLLRSALGGYGNSLSIAPVSIKNRVVGLLCITDQPDAEVASAIANAIGETLLALLAKRKR